MSKSKVYKLRGESYEISEEPVVYNTYNAAINAARSWEDFLGMPLEEALKYEEIFIDEWSLEG